ncbi:hypothetical protein C8A00DRAFT_36255 [Chaetomidium leptoderma]|uniref:Uncharacterized protein n=1 Tax=Chaetomidium leptoderma TaxID=669021 RepID=A0AAN6VHV3_9PEZI|nr:hypothetical protein C8A00DRAFT_36255 [Chaetomidium leptoderma]
MGVQVGCCSVCRVEFEASLLALGIANYTKTTRNGKTLYTIHIPGSPSTWPKASLRAICWKQLKLDFAYHASTRRGDVICCTNY